MITYKTQAEIEKMRRAGQVLFAAMKAVKSAIRPGVTTAELDRVAESVIRSHGAIPSEKGYEGFPGSICASPDDMVVHGIPSESVVLREGQIISIDCTDCTRGDGLTAPEFLKQVKAKYPNIIIMADCATLEEAKAAYAAGADLVGSTMNGYTPQTADCKGDPNYELVEQMVAELPCPVIAEGRVHTPEQAKKMLELGALAVVVGGAITRPLEIATRFMTAVGQR